MTANTPIPAEPAQSSPEGGAAAAAPAPSAAPWILVVDDEGSITELIALVLREQGWGVRVADSAETASRVIAAAGTPPALLICDVIMGRTDGLEFTRRLLARLPHLKVLLVSAHLAAESWWPADLRTCPFLPKPFRNEDLIAAVRSALAG